MKELETVSAVVAETNAVMIPDAMREALVGDLKPVADRLSGYAAVAASVVCSNESDANELAGVLVSIDTDIKSVESCDVLSRTIAGLHGLHRKWTALRNLFTDPMTRDKKTIREAVRVWQTEQERLAEQRRAILQAQADERARVERERLEKKAAAYKTEEKKAAMMEQAAAVITPTVMVAAPKVIGVRRVWAVTNVDMDAFLAAAAVNPALRGYIEIDNTRLVRSKVANPALNVPGIVFELQVR